MVRQQQFQAQRLVFVGLLQAYRAETHRAIFTITVIMVSIMVLMYLQLRRDTRSALLILYLTIRLSISLQAMISLSRLYTRVYQQLFLATRQKMLTLHTSTFMVKSMVLALCFQVAQTLVLVDILLLTNDTDIRA